VIFNGFKLLFRPSASWQKAVPVSNEGRSPSSLIAAALTAAVFPAASVVVGHLCSAVIGKETHTTAALRAAVGFAATAGGALVAAPALTLLLLVLTESNHGETDVGRAGAVAMGVLWPAWTAGVVLGIPPLFGLGPEIGEILWTLLAVVIAGRFFYNEVKAPLGIRRRWSGRFSLIASLSFALLFIVVTVVPAVTVRSLLGASTVISFALPETDALPLPPLPSW
jgi:hypothetical protein